ncbi:hypothetical protein Q5P01_022117 [Channa striata]|uniref:Leucine rich adaptor protein 1 n=1 Tax=Channa striata TaxID=64152 RepID=A0AA88J8E7_CHASR|nr:hypothetical protein Q5P01_022117 [Channa striata]
MDEATVRDALPALAELENKVGRKTPETLLVRLRDAAVDGSEPPPDLSGGISAKLSYLKREMRWLRSADVRILCQLVTVHEGIEAVSWLMEERGALSSQSGSLTGSLSSLGTVEKPGPWNSACSERVSPTCPRHVTETTEEELEDRQPQYKPDGDSDIKSCFKVMGLQSTGARPPARSDSNGEEVISDTHGERARAQTSAKLQKSQPTDLNTAQLQAGRSVAKTIKRALARSSRVRREVIVDSSFFLTKQSGETQTAHQTREGFKASHSSAANTPDTKKLLPGYDTQWSWVGSQDDVTFL